MRSSTRFDRRLFALLVLAVVLAALFSATWSVFEARRQALAQVQAEALALAGALAASPATTERLPSLDPAGWQSALGLALTRGAHLRVYANGELVAQLPASVARRQHQPSPQWLRRLLTRWLPLSAEAARSPAGVRVTAEADWQPEADALWWRTKVHTGAGAAALLVLAGFARRRRSLAGQLASSEAACDATEDAPRLRQRLAGHARTPEGLAPLVLAQMSEAVLVQDVDGVVTFCNEAAEQLFGYESGELIGKPPTPLIPPWRRNELEHASGPQACEIETQRLTKLGKLLDVLLWTMPLRDPATGVTIGCISTLHDITQRKQEETMLRMLERGIPVFPDGVIITDATRDNALMYANPAIEQITGYAVDEIVGRNPRFLYADEHEQEGLAELKDAIRHGRPCRVILHNHRKDGTAFWNELSIAPVHDPHGRVSHFMGLLRDVTERTRHEDRLVRAERRLRTVIDDAPIGTCITDEHDVLHTVNPAFCMLLGSDPDRLLGRPVHDVIPAHAWARVLPGDSEARPSSTELELTRHDGARRTVLASAAMLTGTDGSTQRVTFVMDITARKRAEQALGEEKERAQVTLESIGDGVITTNAQGIVDYLNPVAEQLTGWYADDSHGMPLDQLFHILDEDSRQPLQDPVERALRLGRMITVARQALLVRRDGKEFAVQITAAPIRNREEKIIGGVVVFHDVTEMRAVTRQMTQEARYDPLTGLLNRREFERRLAQALDVSRDDNKEHVLGFLDLDRFKPVNDICGHAAGDELLKRISGTIQAQLREVDVLARLGGDEFGILLQSCSVEMAQRIADNVRKAVKELHFTWRDRSFEIGVSIGLAPVDATTGSIGDLLSAADAACYAAKHGGRNRVEVYRGEEQDTEAPQASKERWIRRIRAALEHDRFVLYAQHAQGLSARAHGYCEILLRLEDEPGVCVSPGSVLPPSERYHLMRAIDEWVVGALLAYLGRHGAELPAQDLVYAVNLSPQSYCSEGFADHVLEQIERSAVPPQRICFELKESDVNANFTGTMAFVRRLREHGVRFALDDFGCARSWLAHMSSIPMDYWKIEGAIVKRIADHPIDVIMVEAITRIGQLTDVQVIAKHVEDAATLEKLRGLAVDYVQGFKVEQPRPLHALADLSEMQNA